MNQKTAREILLIKQKYGILDNDPVFALLDAYGELQKDIVHSIRMLEKAKKGLSKSLNELSKEEDSLETIIKDGRLAVREEGLEVKNILTDDMKDRLEELFSSIDAYRTTIIEEKKRFTQDRSKEQKNVSSLFQKFAKAQKSQNIINIIAFVLIVSSISVQSVLAYKLYRFIS